MYYIMAVFFIVLFLYPYIIYPILLKFLPKQTYPNAVERQTPTVAIVFCAYNEAAILKAKIANLREIKNLYPDTEIFAYSDLSDDGSFEMLEAADDVLTAVQAEERLGKATGMRKLVSLVESDVIIFTDANVILDSEAVRIVASYFCDPSIGTVAGKLIYVNESEGATAAIGGAYWSLEEKIKLLESKTGSTTGADGSIFATRRALYPEVPPHLLDDLISSITPLFCGLRVVSAPDVLAYEKLATSSQDEFKRKRRIACRAFNTHRYLWPKILKISRLDIFKYLSHKVIRWFGALSICLANIFLFMGFIDSFGIAAGLGLLFVEIVFIFAIFTLKIGPLMKIAEILRAIFATAVGVFDSMNGKTYQVWSPAASRN
jgi:cellulose synthase/poly-beta-1,6-N-acetylglucosamine synthase-like glycosyltransferase